MPRRKKGKKATPKSITGGASKANKNSGKSRSGKGIKQGNTVTGTNVKGIKYKYREEQHKRDALTGKYITKPGESKSKASPGANKKLGADSKTRKGDILAERIRAYQNGSYTPDKPQKNNSAKAKELAQKIRDYQKAQGEGGVKERLQNLIKSQNETPKNSNTKDTNKNVSESDKKNANALGEKPSGEAKPEISDKSEGTGGTAKETTVKKKTTAEVRDERVKGLVDKETDDGFMPTNDKLSQPKANKFEAGLNSITQNTLDALKDDDFDSTLKSTLNKALKNYEDETEKSVISQFLLSDQPTKTQQKLADKVRKKLLAGETENLLTAKQMISAKNTMVKHFEKGKLKGNKADSVTLSEAIVKSEDKKVAENKAKEKQQKIKKTLDERITNIEKFVTKLEDPEVSRKVAAMMRGEIPLEPVVNSMDIEAEEIPGRRGEIAKELKDKDLKPKSKEITEAIDTDNLTKIGEGGGSDVYRKGNLAIKVERNAAPGTEEFLREQSELSNRLADEGLAPRTYGVFTDKNGNIQTVMENLDGYQNLAEILKDMDEEEVRDYMQNYSGTLKNIAETLDRLGLVHTDLMEHNIMINDETEELMLIDFEGLQESTGSREDKEYNGFVAGVYSGKYEYKRVEGMSIPQYDAEGNLKVRDEYNEVDEAIEPKKSNKPKTTTKKITKAKTSQQKLDDGDLLFKDKAAADKLIDSYVKDVEMSYSDHKYAKLTKVEPRLIKLAKKIGWTLDIQEGRSSSTKGFAEAEKNRISITPSGLKESEEYINAIMRHELIHALQAKTGKKGMNVDVDGVATTKQITPIGIDYTPHLSKEEAFRAMGNYAPHKWTTELEAFVSNKAQLGGEDLSAQTLATALYRQEKGLNKEGGYKTNVKWWKDVIEEGENRGKGAYIRSVVRNAAQNYPELEQLVDKTTPRLNANSAKKSTNKLSEKEKEAVVANTDVVKPKEIQSKSLKDSAKKYTGKLKDVVDNAPVNIEPDKQKEYSKLIDTLAGNPKLKELKELMGSKDFDLQDAFDLIEVLEVSKKSSKDPQTRKLVDASVENIKMSLFKGLNNISDEQKNRAIGNLPIAPVAFKSKTAGLLDFYI